MADGTLSQWVIQLKLLREGLGYVPLFAIVILALSITGYFVALPLQRDILAKNRHTLTTARAFPSASNNRLIVQERHREFRARLVPLSEKSNLLKALFKEAADAGVTLAQGDYQLLSDTDCNCRQLQVTLPVRGTYLQIRAFVDATLEKIPALSLDEISFRRDSVKIPAVEARLRVSFYLKDGD